MIRQLSRKQTAEQYRKITQEYHERLNARDRAFQELNARQRAYDLLKRQADDLWLERSQLVNELQRYVTISKSKSGMSAKKRKELQRSLGGVLAIRQMAAQGDERIKAIDQEYKSLLSKQGNLGRQLKPLRETYSNAQNALKSSKRLLQLYRCKSAVFEQPRIVGIPLGFRQSAKVVLRKDNAGADVYWGGDRSFENKRRDGHGHYAILLKDDCIAAEHYRHPVPKLAQLAAKLYDRFLWTGKA
jgi:hypothetical protein